MYFMQLVIKITKYHVIKCIYEFKPIIHVFQYLIMTE